MHIGQFLIANLPPKHPLICKILAQADLRSRTGGSVVAIMRNGKVTTNPKSMTIFEEEDRIGLIDDKDQIEAAERLFSLHSGIDGWAQDFRTISCINPSAEVLHVRPEYIEHRTAHAVRDPNNRACNLVSYISQKIVLDLNNRKEMPTCARNIH